MKLPKWCEELKVGGNAGKAYEALAIAVEALEQYSKIESYNGEKIWSIGNPALTAKEALRRIKELGK